MTDFLLVLIVILILVLIWRGPKTLPEIGRMFGRGVREARAEAGKLRASDDDKPADGGSTPSLSPGTVGAQQLLDAIPIPLLFVVVALLAFGIHEGGFRLGVRQERLDPTEKDGPTGLMVGAILALMGFLLATATAMAADRFDGRRALVVDEANAIETTFLRAGYLEAPAGADIRNLLRQYAPLRINVLDHDAYQQNLAASKVMLDDIWAKAEDVARKEGGKPVVALFVDSLNDAIDLLATRDAALTNGRVPETVIWLLLLGALLSAGVVGFYAGLLRRRGFVGAVALIVLLSAALVFVIGLDRPRDDLLRVSQQPIQNVIEEMGQAR